MEYHLLADRPEYIPELAAWYFAEWGKDAKGNNLEREADQLRQYLNRDQIPLSVLALDGDRLAGAAQLKYREMKQFPEREHWLGGVYVAKEFRGKGLATKLVQEIVRSAKQYKVKELWLQTEHLNGGLYAKLGWEPDQIVKLPTYTTLVMKKSLPFE
ncbi:MAG: GNAT family N-acetyltransferase [Bacteroidota bacterium]